MGAGRLETFMGGYLSDHVQELPLFHEPPP
jgi:hypothetical protein